MKALTFDPVNTPIDNIYKDIEDLVDLSGKAHVPMTPAQAISIAYVILWRTSVLKESLNEWINLPAADKTWPRFKTHFRNAVKTYKQLRGPTVQDSMFHQQSANLIQNMKAELKTVIAEKFERHTANMASMTPFHPDPYAFPSDSSHNSNMQNQLDHMANAISDYQQLVPSLVNQVQQLQSVIKQLKQDNRFSSPPTNVTSDTSTLTSNASTAASSTQNYVFKPPFHLY